MGEIGAALVRWQMDEAAVLERVLAGSRSPVHLTPATLDRAQAEREDVDHRRIELQLLPVEHVLPDG